MYSPVMGQSEGTQTQIDTNVLKNRVLGRPFRGGYPIIRCLRESVGQVGSIAAGLHLHLVGDFLSLFYSVMPLFSSFLNQRVHMVLCSLHVNAIIVNSIL